jgi:hypothetical protein
MSIGSIMPVDSFPPNTLAIIGIAGIIKALIPVFDAPIRKDANMSQTHCVINKSNIISLLLFYTTLYLASIEPK